MKLLDPAHPQRTLIIAEETANFITHFLGFLMSLVAAAAIWHAVRTHPDIWIRVGCGIYAVTLVLVFAISTLSHSFQRPAVRHFFRMLDQVCIFLVIAGTYTPFALAYFRDTLGMVLLGAVWLCALVGIVFKVSRSRLNNVSTIFYVLMGWFPMLAAKLIYERVPHEILAWIAAAGVMFTVGTLFLSNDHKHPYYHAVWHVMVIAGSICNFIGVMLVLAPNQIADFVLWNI